MAAESGGTSGRADASNKRARRTPADLTKVSRRTFLIGAGSAVAVPAHAQADPSLSVSGTILTITLGGASWSLDNRVWGLNNAPQLPKPQQDPDGNLVAFEPIIREGVLAGTNMRFDLEARLFKDSINGWLLTILFRKEAQATYRFGDWVSGNRPLAFTAPKSSLTIDSATLVIPPGKWLLKPDFTVHSDPRSIARPAQLATGRFAGAAAKLSIDPPRSPADPNDPDGARFVFSGFVFERLDRGSVRDARAAHRPANEGRDATRGIVLSHLGDGWVDLLPTSATVAIATYQAWRRKAAAINVTGPEAFIDFVDQDGPSQQARLRIHTFELKGTLDSFRRRAGLGGFIADPPNGFTVGDFSFSCGSQGPPFSIPCLLDRPVSKLELPVRVASLHIAAIGADRCDIQFERLDADLRFGASDRNLSPGANIVDVEQGIASVSLDAARFQLRRSRDMFDLGFSLVGFRLRAEQGKVRLMPVAGIARPLLVVHFPPQHILEECFQPVDQAKSANPIVKTKNFLRSLLAGTFLSTPQRKISDSVPLYGAGDPETFLARTLASGPSRLVFDLSGKWSAPQELRLATFVDWTSLPLVTSKRAAPGTLPLERPADAIRGEIASQLDIPGITRTTSRSEARQLVRQTLIPPSATETALELVTGLVFSPDNQARFDPPPPQPDEQRPQLWSARYDGDRTATRALWAPDFDPEFIPASSTTSDWKDDFPLAVVPDRPQRWQIVALSSVFGLGALRRVTLAGVDRDDGSVRRPENYSYLSPETRKSPATGQDVFQEGTYVPKPFRRFDSSLSALGATLNAEWLGEPPATLSSDPFFGQTALTVERYEHRSRHGRDAHVVVLEKGFLFPIGIRVTLVTLAERHYLPFKGEPGAGPVAYLIRRRFIRRVAKDKKFPALYQPFQGNDLHFRRRFTLVTEQTPDITPLEAFGLGEGVFWPTTPGSSGQPSGNEFAFEYRLDDDGEGVVRRAPMLFVRNDAAHSEDKVKKLIASYNALSASADTEYLTIETAPDAPTVFAPESSPGETTFNARRISFAARPRFTLSATGGEPAFDMDAFMEGDDQPPWYPVFNYGYVAMQSLDRLTGRANGLIRVGYDPTYVANGFDHTSNPSELYLRTLDAGVDLDVSGQGDSTGGVAKPNARLAAVSRRVGFVGGMPGKNLEKRTKALADESLHLAPGTDDSPFALDSASQGKFDPLEFFGGALAEAKLLGIIPLKDVIRAALIDNAPKLIEQVEHDVAGAAGGLLEVLLDIVKTLESLLTSAVNAVAAQIAKQLKLGGADGAANWFSDLYPALSKAFDQLNATLAASKNTLADPTTANLGEIASALVRDGKAALNAIEDVARDPRPPVLIDLIKKLRADYDQIASAVEALAEGKANVRNLLATTLFDELARQIASAGIAQSLFGPAEYGGSVGVAEAGGLPLETASSADADRQSILLALSDPQRAAARAARALFAQQVGNPFVAVFLALAENGPASSPFIAWSRGALIDRLAGQIRALAIAAWQLAESPNQPQTLGQPQVPEIDDRYFAPAVARLVAAVEKGVADASKGSKVPTLETLLGNIDDIVATQLDALRQDISRSKTEIDGKAALTRTAIDKELGLLAGQLGAAERARHEALIAQLTVQLQVAQSASEILAALSLSLSSASGSASFRKAILEPISSVLADAYANAGPILDAALGAADGSGGRTLAIVADHLFEALRQSVEFAAVAKLGNAAAGWWTEGSGGKAIDAAFALVDAMFDEEAAIATSIDAIAERLRSFKFANAPESAQLESFRQFVAASQSSLQRVRDDVQAIHQVREAIGRLVQANTRRNPVTAAAPLANNVDLTRAHLLDPVGRALDLRESLVGRLRDFIAQLRLAVESIPKAASGLGPSAQEIGDLEKAANEVREKILQLAVQLTALGAKAGSRWSRVKSAAASAAAVGTAASDTIAITQTNLETAADDLNSKFQDAAQDFAKTEAWLVSLETMTRDLDRAFTSAILSTAALADDLAGKLVEVLRAPAKAVVDLLVRVHGEVTTVVTDLAKMLEGDGTGATTMAQTFIALLGKNLLDKMNAAIAALTSDQASLNAIQTAIGPPTNESDLDKEVEALRDRWRIADPGVAQVVGLARFIVNALASGQIGDLISLDALKDELRRIPERLIPSKAHLKYDWSAPLSDYPSDDPIFAIDRGAESDPTQPLIPKPGVGTDLVLASRVEVDLRTGGRIATATGGIAPFRVRLLGSSLDLLTVYFKGAWFDASLGQKPTFKADIDRVVIGKLLQFIKPLEAYFGKFHVFVRPVIYPIGIEAGFDFNEPYIDIGILFLNVAGGATLFLPFDDHPGEIRANFATREHPFMIVVRGSPPMGGGGFIRLVATASGIISFEIQFEFGAVMALNYSPLSAQGRVTAGIYLLSSASERVLEGFVHAVGEGQIACFGISVNVEVTIRQENGGRMTGSSSYSISFKIGFATFSYRFTASYTVPGGSAAGAGQGVRFAPNGTSNGSPSVSVARAGTVALGPPTKAKVYVPNKQKAWAAYASHFSQSW